MRKVIVRILNVTLCFMVFRIVKLKRAAEDAKNKNKYLKGPTNHINLIFVKLTHNRTHI